MVNKKKTVLVVGSGALALATLTTLLMVLSSMGVVITSDGDTICGENCTSYIYLSNFTRDIVIKNISGLKIDFAPEPAEFDLLLPIDVYPNYIGDSKYISYKLINQYTFKKGRNYTLILKGKKSPVQNIKWGIGIGDSYLDPWWNSSYPYCKNVTINNPVETAQTDYPVPIKITYDSDMQADFDDIRFYSGGCSGSTTALYAELESKTDSTTAYTWVEIPSLATGNNVIGMFYGNSAVASNWDNGANVWDSGFVLIMHMYDTHDSSSYQNNGTLSGPTSTTGGFFGNAYNWTGTSSQAINISNSVSLNITTQNSTYEAWSYVAKYAVANPRLISKESGTTAEPYALELANTGDAELCTLNNGTTSEQCTLSVSTLAGVGKWSYIAGSNKLGPTPRIKTIFINGTANYTDTTTGTVWMNGSKNNAIRIGNNYVLSRYMNGTIDEVRISNVLRSTSWINLTYQLMANQATYVTFAAEENGYVSTNMTIWNGTGWQAYVVGSRKIIFRCTRTQQQCQPDNQSTAGSQGIFRVCNNGTIAGTGVAFNINVTNANINVLCDDDYTYAGATTLSTSNQTIAGAIAIGACVDFSCWADYNTPTSFAPFKIAAYVLS